MIRCFSARARAGACAHLDRVGVGYAGCTGGLSLCRQTAAGRGHRFTRCCTQQLLFCGRAVMAVGRPEAQEHPPENGFTPLEHPAPRLLPHIDGSVLPSLGGFGKHQKQLVVLTWIPALFIGFSQFSDYFLLAQPNGTCVQPTGNHSNWTAAFPSITTAGDAPALHRTGNGTPGEGDGEMLCACKEWKLELQTGLSQNVVTKVTSGTISKYYVHYQLHHHHPVSAPSCKLLFRSFQSCSREVSH